MTMDPVTAAFNFGAALMNFLATVEGQKVAAINNQLIVDVLTALHVKITPVTSPAK